MHLNQRKKDILKIVSIQLIDNKIPFNYSNNNINAEDYFKLTIYSKGEVEIITNKYNKDFKFLSDVSNAFILDVIDRIIFNY